MKLPHRYSFPDPYITEELRKQYNSASSERRLRLLAKLNKEKIPYGVAVLAVQDPDARVRAWFAKNAVVLRYEPKEQGGECHDFEATLASDNDPYVNACLYENPMGPGGVQNFDQAMRVFGDAKPLSRLALVRNCNVSLELIEQIFRFDEPKLGISLNERSELVRAFLTNHKVIAQSHKDSFDFADGFAWFTTTRHFNTLWSHISAWPEEEKAIKKDVYQWIGADMVTRTSVLKSTEDAGTRACILMSSSPDQHSDALTLGRIDKHNMCREFAFQRSRLTKEQFVEALGGTDLAPLRGLALNMILSAEELRQVSDRLNELGDSFHADDAFYTIGQLEDHIPPDNPKELFGHKGRGKFLEQKIDYIGRRIVNAIEYIDYCAPEKGPGEAAWLFSLLKQILK